MEQLNLEEVLETKVEEDFKIEFEYILTEVEEQLALVRNIENAFNHKKWLSRHYQVPNVDLNNRDVVESCIKNLSLNRSEILRRANVLKHIEIYDKSRLLAKEIEAKKRREEMVRLWDYKNMYLHLISNFQAQGKTFDLDEFNRDGVMAICFFLSEEARFETELNLDFKKGLLFRGDQGTGKSDLISMLADNGRNPISSYSMLEITEEVQTEGSFQIYMPLNGKINIDDVGTEQSIVNHFGNKKNWFKDFIEKSYYQKVDFSKIIVSTNLSWDEIGEHYGMRAYSRMKEKFNDVLLYGDDRRLKSIS